MSVPTAPMGGNFESLPEIDAPSLRKMLDDIHKDAEFLASSIEATNMSLKARLHMMTDCATKFISVHKDSVHELSDTVDMSMAIMSSLMAGCERISENMQPVEVMHEQIVAVNGALDVLEKLIDEQDKNLRPLKQATVTSSKT